jgi:hypothetical protein
VNVKSILSKTIALSLCVSLLFGSFGFTLDLHLCQGKIKTFNLFGEAQKCVEMDENTVCKSANSSPIISKRKCCTDASVYSKTVVESDIISSQIENLVLGVNPYSQLKTETSIQTIIFTSHYHPPPENKSGRTILVLNQTFLI